MRRFIVLLPLAFAGMGSCGGCERPTAPTIPQRVYVLSYSMLTRDHATASAYTGHQVQFRLRPDTYTVEGNEIRVWANQPLLVPPILICRCGSPPPSGKFLLVTGVSRGPTSDGIWRTPSADFWVLVDDCSVVVTNQ